MATSRIAATVGYDLYRESAGLTSRDELNEALVRQNLPPVSLRMMSHYRSLWDAGVSKYVSINEFDLKRRRQRRHIHSVFVTASPGYDLRPLVSALSARDLKVLTSGDASASESVGGALRDQVARADACIAVVSRQPYDSVLFEMGVAFGLEMPIILAAERQLSELLRDLQWLPRVLLDAGKVDPLVAAVDRLRERPTTTRPPRERTRTRRIDPASFASAAAGLSGFEFEALVVDLVEECGGEVHGRSTSATGFDFAVWIPRLEPVVPNPLLVEVKLAIPDAPSMVLQQVADYLEQTGGTSVAMLVYRDGPPSEQIGRGVFPVIPVRFDELLTELRDRPFHEVVRRRRNLAVHFFTT